MTSEYMLIMMISPMLFRWHNKSIESNRRWAHSFRKWLVAYSTASHYLNKCLVYCSNRHKSKWFVCACFFFFLFFFFVFFWGGELSKYKTKINPRKSISRCRLRNGDHFGPWRDDLKWGKWKDFDSFYISGLVYASRYIPIRIDSPTGMYEHVKQQ